MFDEAIKELDEVIGVDGNNPDALSRRAQLQLFRGHPDKAIQDYRRSIENGEEKVLTFYNLGNLLLSLNHYREAEGYLRKALEKKNKELERGEMGQEQLTEAEIKSKLIKAMKFHREEEGDGERKYLGESLGGMKSERYKP